MFYRLLTAKNALSDMKHSDKISQILHQCLLSLVVISVGGGILKPSTLVTKAYYTPIEGFSASDRRHSDVGGIGELHPRCWTQNERITGDRHSEQFTGEVGVLYEISFFLILKTTCFDFVCGLLSMRLNAPNGVNGAFMYDMYQSLDISHFNRFLLLFPSSTCIC